LLKHRRQLCGGDLRAFGLLTQVGDPALTLLNV
jgi:hypothetical protein